MVFWKAIKEIFWNFAYDQFSFVVKEWGWQMIFAKVFTVFFLIFILLFLITILFCGFRIIFPEKKNRNAKRYKNWFGKGLWGLGVCLFGIFFIFLSRSDLTAKRDLCGEILRNTHEARLVRESADYGQNPEKYKFTSDDYEKYISKYSVPERVSTFYSMVKGVNTKYGKKDFETMVGVGKQAAKDLSDEKYECASYYGDNVLYSVVSPDDNTITDTLGIASPVTVTTNLGE